MIYVQCLRNALPITNTLFPNEAEARIFATTLADAFEVEAWRRGNVFYVDMTNMEALEEISRLPRIGGKI